MQNLRRLAQLAKRIEKVAPMFKAHGPFIYDPMNEHWWILAEERDAHALALELLRLPRRPGIGSDKIRQVVYVRGQGTEEYLRVGTRKWFLESTAQDFLHAVVQVLEEEHSKAIRHS